MTRSHVRAVFLALLAAFVLVLPVSAADPPSLELAGTVQLSGPAGKRLDHMALDSKRDRLLVANSGNSSLDVIDLKAGKLLKSIPEQPAIQGVIYVPAVDRVFATLGGGVCNVFDAAAFKPVKSIKIPDADNIRQDPRSGLVYVSRSGKKLAVLDPKSLEAKPDVELTSGPESFVMEAGRPRLYVNVPTPRQVLVVDTDKGKVLRKDTLPEAGNYPLALDEPGHRLFVGCRKEPMLIVLDTETGKQLSSVAIPNDVDDLFWDAKRKRLYASCGEGWVVTLKQTEGNRFQLQDKFATAKMSRTSLFDAEGSRLFVALPRQADKAGPEVRIYRVRP